MVLAFEEASAKKIPYEIVAKRQGDLAEYFADPSMAENYLNGKRVLILK
jgi:UDP-glucose 4-epimerase